MKNIDLNLLKSAHAHIFVTNNKAEFKEQITDFFSKSNDVDYVHWISAEKKEIKKTQILELRTIFKFKDFDIASFYIIEDADKMNKSAYNALLKMLEEPISNLFAVLITDQILNIPATIKSRAQVNYLEPQIIEAENDENYQQILSLLQKKDYIKYKQLFETKLKEEGEEFLPKLLEFLVTTQNDKVMFIKILDNTRYNLNQSLIVDEVYYTFNFGGDIDE